MHPMPPGDGYPLTEGEAVTVGPLAPGESVRYQLTAERDGDLTVRLDDLDRAGVQGATYGLSLLDGMNQRVGSGAGTASYPTPVEIAVEGVRAGAIYTLDFIQREGSGAPTLSYTITASAFDTTGTVFGASPPWAWAVAVLVILILVGGVWWGRSLFGRGRKHR